jgi:hypothetical protein
MHMRAEHQHEFSVLTMDDAGRETPKDTFVGNAAPTWLEKSVNLEGSVKVHLYNLTRDHFKIVDLGFECNEKRY